MKNYLFITNSRRPSTEVYESKDPIVLKNDSIPCVEAALKLGYKVYMGVNRKYASELKCVGYDVEFYNADIYSSIFDFKTNYKAFNNLSNLIKEKKINVIHCNSPIGGFLGRICGYLCKVEKVIYTAHGFHFYKGAPFYYNLVFKSIEKVLARITDVIITINDEDYKAALKFNVKKNTRIFKVPGVGIDTDYNNKKIDREELLNKLGLSEESFVIISVGDLNKNKNFEFIIQALSYQNDVNVHLLICGKGPRLRKLRKLAYRLKLDNNVHFLGFRNDIDDLLNISKVFTLTSYREGLPRSLMEAMSKGLICIVSNIRGNVDLIKNGINGYIIGRNDYLRFVRIIEELKVRKELKSNFSDLNKLLIEEYSISNVKKVILSIYESELVNNENSTSFKQ